MVSPHDLKSPAGTAAKEKKPEPRAARVAFWCLALSVILLPLFFGGNRLLPLFLAQGGLIAFFLCHGLSCGSLHNWPLRLRAAAGLCGAVMIWIIIQAMGFTPAAWDHPLWEQSAAALGMESRGAISLAPEHAFASLGRMITYFFMLVGVYIVATDSSRARKLLKIFWVVGAGACIYALSMHVLGIEYVLWSKKTDYIGDVTGTFINRNHFADYAGLVFLTGFALAWQSWRNISRQSKLERRGDLIEAWLMRAGTGYVFALGIVLCALLFSHSRAGLVSFFIGLIVFVAAFLFYHKRNRTAFTMTALLALFILILFMMFGQHSERFVSLFSDNSSIDRFKVYMLTKAAILDRPWLGHGFGAFEKAFSPLTGDSFRAIFNHAHSDWLETAFDLGLPIAGLLAMAIVLTVSGCVHGIRTRRHDGLFPALGLAASALILCHALVEFNTQIPGLVSSWLLLLGCGIGQGWSTQRLSLRRAFHHL